MRKLRGGIWFNLNKDCANAECRIFALRNCESTKVPRGILKIGTCVSEYVLDWHVLIVARANLRRFTVKQTA